MAQSPDEGYDLAREFEQKVHVSASNEADEDTQGKQAPSSPSSPVPANRSNADADGSDGDDPGTSATEAVFHKFKDLPPELRDLVASGLAMADAKALSGTCRLWPWGDQHQADPGLHEVMRKHCSPSLSQLAIHCWRGPQLEDLAGRFFEAAPQLVLLQGIKNRLENSQWVPMARRQTEETLGGASGRDFVLGRVEASHSSKRFRTQYGRRRAELDRRYERYD
ncbi:hypothetical protein CSOJ01_08525 [Colletotrichum sojae]|uniref:Uncharacterized protein n=1 Tax=Colletotrichum sojae TaxID=2175907 RepID=A0A8H6J678_9PEZI|nr:hypothetical protein CSOJ01_08525 [Colletotrichum sojae]